MIPRIDRRAREIPRVVRELLDVDRRDVVLVGDATEHHRLEDLVEAPSVIGNGRGALRGGEKQADAAGAPSHVTCPVPFAGVETGCGECVAHAHRARGT